MSKFQLRTMEEADWPEVANLIYLSTNTWYQNKLGVTAFNGDPGQRILLLIEVDAMPYRLLGFVQAVYAI